MNKTLTFRQVAALKRTAQNNYPLVAKLQKMEEKIAEMQDEMNIIRTQIDGAEMGSKALTGGYTSFELIDREVISTGKFDKDGRELKVSKYVPKAGALVATDNGNYEIVLGTDVPEAAPAPTAEDFEPVREAAPENDVYFQN